MESNLGCRSHAPDFLTMGSERRSNRICAHERTTGGLFTTGRLVEKLGLAWSIFLPLNLLYRSQRVLTYGLEGRARQTGCKGPMTSQNCVMFSKASLSPHGDPQGTLCQYVSSKGVMSVDRSIRTAPLQAMGTRRKELRHHFVVMQQEWSNVILLPFQATSGPSVKTKSPHFAHLTFLTIGLRLGTLGSQVRPPPALEAQSMPCNIK